MAIRNRLTKLSCLLALAALSACGQKPDENNKDVEWHRTSILSSEHAGVKKDYFAVLDCRSVIADGFHEYYTIYLPIDEKEGIAPDRRQDISAGRKTTFIKGAIFSYQTYRRLGSTSTTEGLIHQEGELRVDNYLVGKLRFTFTPSEGTERYSFSDIEHWRSAVYDSENSLGYLVKGKKVECR